MYKNLERVNLLLSYLSDALNTSKKSTFIDQQIKMNDLESINVGDGGSLTIQNQCIVIHKADEYIDEAKQIVQELLKIMPSPKLPLPKATKLFRKAAVMKALEATNGHKTNAAKLLGMKRSSLGYLTEEKKQ